MALNKCLNRRGMIRCYRFGVRDYNGVGLSAYVIKRKRLLNGSARFSGQTVQSSNEYLLQVHEQLRKPYGKQVGVE